MIAMKRVIFDVLGASGAGAIARRATCHSPRVLMYHGFREDADIRPGHMSRTDFAKQLAYIKRYYTPWKLSDLVKYYNDNGIYPENSVAITVDDGYENFYSIALPLLKKFGIPATVFVVAKAADENRWLWTDIITHLFNSTPALNGHQQIKITSSLKAMSPTQRNRALHDLLSNYAILIPPTPPPKYRLMSWSQLREAFNCGLVEVGAHSCTHPILAYLDSEESRQEILGAKQIIEHRLGLEVTSYCYPNGQPGDYTEEHKKLIISSGYTCCTASHPGFVEHHSDHYALPRIACQPRINRFRLDVDGLIHIYLACRAALNRSQ